MSLLKEIKESVYHLVFPHICAGCGSDLINKESMLCMHCLAIMPDTNFYLHADNPVEKSFWGRLPVASATAQYYFTKDSMMQHLMHQLKYKGNKEVGIYLGRLAGVFLNRTERFNNAEALIPVPLFAAKEKRRGYNQAHVLCEGISEAMNIPVLSNVIIRDEHTDTQTKKSRVERWQNIEGKFELTDPAAIINKHVLLVDDVITTGATIEACGIELMKAPDVRLSVAALCYASR